LLLIAVVGPVLKRGVIALGIIKDVAQVFKNIWKNIPIKREFTVIKLSEQ
tara:strand:- start:245922 stop:246071 length:150 start_codon:yes stop_codon:yes gene_type:complete